MKLDLEFSSLSLYLLAIISVSLAINQISARNLLNLKISCLNSIFIYMYEVYQILKLMDYVRFLYTQGQQKFKNVRRIYNERCEDGSL